MRARSAPFIALVCSTLAYFAWPGCNGGPPDVREECRRFASLYCGPMAFCAPSTFYGWYGDLGTCVQQGAVECEQTVNAVGSRTTPQDLIACAYALACTEAKVACPLPRGMQPAESSCVLDAQCASGVCVRGSLGCGACQARASAGAGCGFERPCEAGLYCPEGTCVPQLPADAQCWDWASCAAGLVCIDGLCAKQPLPGDSCTTSEDCYNWPCIEGTCRSYEEGITEADFAEVGADCLAAGCRAGSCHSGTCVALPRAGEPCLSTSEGDTYRYGPLCMPPAICARDFKCALPIDAACE